MDETITETEVRHSGRSKITRMARRYTRITILVAEYIFDEIVDAIVDSAKVIQSEGRLFMGLALSVIGLMDFSNGKYCDGNAADYLSCTRPTVFYYYGTFEIVLVVIGVMLVVVWSLKRWQKKAAV
jgi:hypothetical protein